MNRNAFIVTISRVSIIGSTCRRRFNTDPLTPVEI